MAPRFLRWLRISLFAISSLTASPQAHPGPENVAELSFVVLRSSEKDSLVRVSADGKSVTTIAHGAPGVGLAKDTVGNYVIAAETKLLRVTPEGLVTTLAVAPSEAEWVAILPGPADDFIVADARKHVLWRVSQDGKSVTEFARYPGWKRAHALGFAAHESADYFLLRLGDEHELHFYRISPSGIVARVPLRGDVAPIPIPGPPIQGGNNALMGGTMISDGSGNFLFLDHPLPRTLFRITPAGVVTKGATLARGPIGDGLSRNPKTGDILVTGFTKLFRVTVNAETMEVFNESSTVRSGTAILVESQRSHRTQHQP